LKNRKSARKSRKRRKAELTTLRDEIKALKHENDLLKQKLKNQGNATGN
jgi:predicted nuclease with TOPRIM domain